MVKTKTKRRDVLECISYELGLSINRDEVIELEDKIYLEYDDFIIDIDGEEFRFIHKDHIWDIYVESVKQMVEDCYDIKAPDWLAINWEKTADNCYVDGYGHHFSHYDGSEYEHTIDGQRYYIFRTN